MTTESAMIPSPAHLGEPYTPPWEQLIERLQLSLGMELEAETIRSVANATSNDEEPWTARLLTACESLAVHAVPMRGTISQAAVAVGPDHPVVTFDANGDWLLLTDRRGRQVEVRSASTEAEWVNRGELAERLDPQGGTLFDWVAVDPPGWDLMRRETAEAGAAGDPPVPSPWRRLRGLMRQERHDIGVTLVYAVGVGVLTLATPIAVQALVNTVAFGTLLQPLAVLTFLLLMGLAFAGVLRALQAWVVEILQRRLFLRLVNDLSHRLPRVELKAFDRAHGPELVNRFFDLFTINKAASSLLIGGLEIVLTSIVGMVVLAFYHPLLLAFDVVLLAIVFAILWGLGRGATESAVKESKAKYEVAGWLEEVARHPIAFKLAGGPSLARQRTDELAAKYLNNRKKHFRVVFRQLAGALALQAFASAGILGIGGWLVIERQLTLGQLVAAELIVTMVVASFAKVGKHLETTYDMLAAIDKVGQLIDLPLEAPRPAAIRPRDTDGPAGLRARGLAFQFEGRAPVFTDVDLDLAPGERVVLGGSSGAGRSALVDVLLGLRAADAGSIQIDGIDLSDLDRAGMRDRTALVRGREVVVGSISDNVAFGRRNIDVLRIREALRAVDLLDEVAALPEGLATRVMPDGSPLSRGQASRLVLARAIAGHPSLLVIDGALDGFDEETRAKLIATTFAADAPWSLLVITDDPTVRAQCGRVVRLEHGQLVDGGAPEVSR